MKARRKILMLGTQLGYGGAETSFIRLANFLAQSMDVTVALFTQDYGKGKYAAGHESLLVPTVILDSNKPTSQWQRWWRRITHVRQLKAQHDVTISFLSGPNLVNVLAGRNSGTVVSLRGSRMYDPVVNPRQRRLFQYLLDPIIYHLAARIVPVSPGLKNEVRQAAGQGVLHKVRPISPFVDNAGLPTRLAVPPPEKYQPLHGQPVIVAVGRLSYEKGFHHLIRVFAALAKTQKGAKLLLVGDGPMMPTLRAQCSELGVAMDDVASGTSAVIFAGYQQQVLPLMALGRAYAMTSATEGFPSVLLEAMAAGLSVIAADTPWGVRAIMNEYNTETTEPYPTSHPTEALYGMLMPRIDRLENQESWVEVLREALTRTDSENSKATKHVHDFDITTVGQRWIDLIETMERA